MPKPMFINKTNYELRQLLYALLHVKLRGSLYDEVYEHERMGHKRKDSQISFLNRIDLVQFLYAILLPEIKLIDDTPLNDIPKLLNHHWSCQELKDRVLERMRGT